MKYWIGNGITLFVKRSIGLAFLGITLASVQANAASNKPRQDPPPGNAQQMTARQAVRILQETLPKITRYATGWGWRKSEGGKLTANGFSVTVSGKDHEFAFNSFNSYIQMLGSNGLFFNPICIDWDKKANGDEDARKTVDALNRLIYDTQHGVKISDVEAPAENWSSFQQIASEWRVLAVKPELPEEVRKQRILAESYLREKDFNGSIQHYELGVRACATWPEGWFNLALLYAEAGEFALAADSMKHYLELMPNSPDAAAARDKVVIWEDKASKARTQP
jgi:tetratricopeptide (TPR) repeat protein